MILSKFLAERIPFCLFHKTRGRNDYLQYPLMANSPLESIVGYTAIHPQNPMLTISAPVVQTLKKGETIAAES